LGYEIYLRDSAYGDELWERIMAAGQPFGLAPGHTSTIRRIEGGMLSYHADADSHTNPYEVGLGRLVDLDMPAQFIGKAALQRIHEQGVRRKQIGLFIEGAALTGPNTEFWAVTAGGKTVGKVTSAVHSPRLGYNIALAMVDIDYTDLGTSLEVQIPLDARPALVVEKPFYDPKKQVVVAA
jgi:aminomethyltransferase